MERTVVAFMRIKGKEPRAQAWKIEKANRQQEGQCAPKKAKNYSVISENSSATTTR